MRNPSPLQPLIAAIEQVRDRSFVCDRPPLDDMLHDLRRWSRQLAGVARSPSECSTPGFCTSEPEPVTVVDRPVRLQHLPR